MKILLVNKFLYRFGGTERYMFDMWDTLQYRGHDVIPFAMDHRRNVSSEYSKYFVSNVEYDEELKSRDILRKMRVALRLIYSFEAKAKMTSLIRDIKPDVAHVHNIYHQISPSILPVLKDHGIPVVQTIHDFKLVCPSYVFFAQGRVCETCKSESVLKAVEQRCVKNSRGATALAILETRLHKALRIYEQNIRLFITPSAFSRDKLAEYGIGANKVVHIRPPMDLTKYAPRFEAGDYALYLGRLAPMKGVTTLLSAMKKLKSVPLVIAGDGEMKSDLVKMIAEEGLVNVKLPGHLTGEELAETVRGARFVVIPSEWYENAPFSVLESFAYGKAVIGSEIGGIPELIEKNVDGLLFTPGNADELASSMAHLWEQPHLCEKMGQNGRRKLQIHFSPNTHYDLLEHIYQDMKRMS